MTAGVTRNLVLVAQARERARELIGRRFGEDLIGADELERRLERVERATTLDEIAVTIDDLVDPGVALVPALLPEPGAGRDLPVRVQGDVPDGRRVVAIFGETRLEGGWVAARRLDVFVGLGEVTLDLRDAVLGPGLTTVRVRVCLGTLYVIVPPGFPVELECMAVMASVERDQEVGEVAAGGGPRLRVEGVAFLGSVEVRERMPGESPRAAKKRHKKERKRERKRALAEARARALGEGE